MSSRGRGFVSRGYRGSSGGYRGSSGGYRGSSYRGTSTRGSGGYRGSRGGYYSTERYSSGGERFSGRIDDGGYKKSYRSDTMMYSSRDYGGRMSPDRKRMRMEGGGERRGEYGAPFARREFAPRRERRSPSDELRPRRGPPRGRGLRGRGTFYRSRPLRFSRKILKPRSSSRLKTDTASSTEGEEDWDAQEEKQIMKEEGIEPAEESPKKDAEAMETAAGDEAADGAATDKEAPEGEAEEGEEGDKKEGKKKAPLARPGGRDYIPLVCVHCKDKCLTFRVYSKHLLSRRHKVAMSLLAQRHKQKLVGMRGKQRAEQRAQEEEGEAAEERSSFCGLCKLNHRQGAAAHAETDSHRKMKRFLAPGCRPCRLAFRSPMLYEHHLCSLEHIRRADALERRAKRPAEAEPDEGRDVDLDNFMTLDSVGDVDELDDSDSGEKKNGEAAEAKKAEINVGSEHVKRVEVQYCELCRVFVGQEPLAPAEQEGFLRRHCRSSLHLSRYVRHRDHRTLRQHAERIHRIHQKQAAADKDVKKEKTDEKTEENGSADNSSVKKEESADTTGATVEDNEGDEKLWADVDKDLGDLLREVDQTAKSSDDEEHSNVGRYDRFRKSEKKNEVAEEVNGGGEGIEGIEGIEGVARAKPDKAAQPAAAEDAKQTA